MRRTQSLPQAGTVQLGQQNRVGPAVGELAARGAPRPIQGQQRVGAISDPGRGAVVELREAEADDGEGLVVRLGTEQLLQYRRQLPG